MGFKIRNYKLAGQEVVFSTETVTFNEEGIAELESENTYLDALNIRNFYRVVEGEVAADPDLEIEDPNVDPTKPTPPASIAKAVRAKENAAKVVVATPDANITNPIETTPDENVINPVETTPDANITNPIEATPKNK